MSLWYFMISRIKRGLEREVTEIDRRDFLVGAGALALGFLGFGFTGIDSSVREVEVPELEVAEPLVDEGEVYFEEVEKFYPKDYTSLDKEKAVEAVYAEARGVSDNEDYLRNVVSTFVTRSLESGKSVSEVIGDEAQYSYLNSGDGNEVRSGEALSHSKKNRIEEEAYARCVRVVDDVFENGLTEDELLTHYFVRGSDVELTSEYCPDWAFTEFNGKEVPKVPEYVIEHGEDVTRFYYSPDTGKAVLAAV